MKYTTFSKYLSETAITFGGKMYPKFNQVVILVGGTGSGKDFILQNLLGIEGIVFDSDKLSELALQTEKIRKHILDTTGYDIKAFDLSNPKDSSLLYKVTKRIELHNRRLQSIANSIIESNPNRKPNIIINITMKDMYAFHKFTDMFKTLGYSPENIHLVWILNDVEVAREQNKTRARRVPETILLDTHAGVKQTFLQILKMGKKLRNFIDGDIYIVFNKKFMDTVLKTSSKGGKYIAKATYVKIKSKAKPPMRIEDLAKRFRDKIEQYTPKVR